MVSTLLDPKPVAQPTEMQRSVFYEKRRGRKPNWHPPTDAALILDLHFQVLTYWKHAYHAEAHITLPIGPFGEEQHVEFASCKTRKSALLKLIQGIEASHWFQVFRAQKVYFRVTGEGMDEIWKGYW